MQTEQDEEITLPKMTAAQWDAILEAANERREAENEATRQKNAALLALIERYRAYAARLEAILTSLQAEQEEQNRIDAEARRLLSPEELADFPMLAAKSLAAN